jgi:ABC-2 type transport system permease protein
MNPLAPSDPSMPPSARPGSLAPGLDGPGSPMDNGRDLSETPDGDAFAVAEPVRLSRRVPLSALVTLLGITAARQTRGRRLLIFSLLFALPILFAVLAHRFQVPYEASEVETVLVFGLIPQALVPLTALLFASGMVQDDVEEQTLTYLLIRPIPRWLIYVAKVAATWLVTSALASVFTAAALVAVYWGTNEPDTPALIRRAMLISGLLSLSLLAYIAIFGGLSLLIRRSLVLGVGYIVVFEGVLANIDFVVRHLTVMYYVRTLSVRWLDLPGADWSIDPATAPSAMTCLLTLFGIGAVLALLGSWLFSIREFRVKTPDGN